MPVTPGSATKINRVNGVAKVVPVTADEVSTTLKDKVFESGVLLKFADGKLYLTDGVTKLSELKPLVDQAMTAAEKAALNNAFKTGSYVASANGVVVHDATGKIADGSLNVVANGKIVASYLSDFIEGGKVKLDALPDTVRAGVAYFATFASMNTTATEENKKGLCFVIDAKDDPSGAVVTGAAMYSWQNDAWLKIAEHESLDIDVAALTPTYENVQAAGAIMYDHTLMLEAPTLTQIAALLA